ncbi:MAG: ABC transporter substrate-binding protein [Microthrixaceae bacterium]
MKCRSLAVAAVVAGLVLTAGCGGSGDDSSSSGSEEGSTSDEPVYGGEVTYGLEAENSGGWCLPEGQLAIAGTQVALAIYDTLTTPNADGDYVPLLAESVEPNEDYTQWTVTLREGVTFHDGSALDATVVKNNLDAFLGNYPARNPLLLKFLFEPISAVEVTGDLTLTISTKVPWPALPAALYSGGRAGIIAQAQLDDTETCDSNLIGTGPFVFEEWAVNDHLRATRNPDYWRTDADGNQLPYLDAIEFRPVVDSVSLANSVVSGGIDMSHSSGSASTGILEGAAEAGDIQLLQSDEFPEVGYTIVNAGKAPFDNRDARLAAAYAVDREEFNQIRNEGMFQIASGPFGPGNVGYLEDAGYPEFDLDKAMEHAAAYEEATGTPLTFTYTYQNDPETAQTAQLLQSMWGRAGIEVEIVPIEQATLISTAISGDYQTISWRNHGGGDPDSQYVWWYGGSPLNFGKFDDPEMNELLDRGRSEVDPAEREAIYEDVNREFGAEAYNQWLTWVEWTIAYQNDIHGVLGPVLPDGSEPFPGLAYGHAVSGIWRSDAG